MTARQEAIVAWVNSVEGLSERCESVEALHDGVLLSEIIGQAAPSDMAIEDIEEVPDDQAAKVTNLQTIVNGLVSFYSDAFGTEDTFDHIDCEAIASQGEGMHEHLNALFELVIGCVINCSDKAVYIEGIQRLDPATQMQIMTVIQGVMSKYGEGMNESLDESFATAGTRTPMTGRKGTTGAKAASARGRARSDSPGIDAATMEELRSLRAQVATLEQNLEAKEQEAHSLTEEVQTLKEEMEESGKREKQKELEKVKMLKTAMSQREVEISGGLRDLESKCAQLEQTNALLQRQLKQKDQAWKEKMQAQADEVAVLRSGANRVEQLEARLHRKTNELKDVASLRKRAEELEQQNLELEDRNLTLQAENTKIATLEKQLQAYRDKLTAAEIAAAEYKFNATSKLDDAEEKIKELQSEVVVLQQQQQQAQNGPEPPSPATPITGYSASHKAELHSLKQQLVRLNNENAQLKAMAKDSNNEGEVGVDSDALRAHFEKRQAELAKENRRLTRQLEAGAATASTTTAATTSSSSGTGDVALYKERLQSKQREVEKLMTEKSKMEAYTQQVLKKLSHSQAEKKKHKSSLSAQKDFYQDKIRAQQASMEAMKVAHRRQEQLFQAAFYNLGREMAPGLLQDAAVNRQRVPGAAAGGAGKGSPSRSGGSSWLSRKRNELKR